MRNHFKAEFLANFQLHGFDARIIEFQDLAAAQTDQMIVVRMSQDVLIKAASFPFQPTHQTATLQQTQRAVNRSARYIGFVILQPQIEIVGVKMVMVPIDLFEDFAPGQSDLLTAVAQKFNEFQFFFWHSRGGEKIVA